VIVVADAPDPLDELRDQIREIRERNARVEREKAWETSWTRRLVIASATWGAACIWLVALDVRNAASHALVPSAAYMLSTFSLPIIRGWWIRRRLE
jgi:hypothetical protein